MVRKSKYTIEQKIEAVLDYKSGKRGTRQICKDLDLNRAGITLYKGIHIYEDFGETGFLHKQKNKSYSKELKEEAVKEYLAGKGSFIDIT